MTAGKRRYASPRWIRSGTTPPPWPPNCRTRSECWTPPRGQLGLGVVDEVHRRVQQDTLTRLGHKGDPLYEVYRVLWRRRPAQRQGCSLAASRAGRRGPAQRGDRHLDLRPGPARVYLARTRPRAAAAPWTPSKRCCPAQSPRPGRWAAPCAPAERIPRLLPPAAPPTARPRPSTSSSKRPADWAAVSGTGQLPATPPAALWRNSPGCILDTTGHVGAVHVWWRRAGLHRAVRCKPVVTYEVSYTSSGVSL